jgi:hypothetical protein
MQENRSFEICFMTCQGANDIPSLTYRHANASNPLNAFDFSQKKFV